PADARGDDVAGGLDVERHAAAVEEAGVEVAEDDVRVGERGLLTAPAIAGGPGIGPRAPRPHPDQPARIHLGDAAAPCADLDHVDEWPAHRQSAARLELVDARHLELVLLPGFVAQDDAALRGG